MCVRNSIVPEMAALFYPCSGENTAQISSFATTSSDRILATFETDILNKYEEP